MDSIELPNGRILDIEDADDADEDVKRRGRDWFSQNGFRSGVSDIALTGRVVGSKFKLKKLPPGQARAAKGKDKRRLEQDRRRLTTGTKSVLALWVEALDAKTNGDEAQLSDNIFGTGTDVVNLRSQYKACSHDKLDFVPAENGSVGITGGVGKVTINQNVTGVNNGEIRDAAVAAGNAQFGTMQSQFDYVMVCIPPGTSGGWIAYAWLNWYLSVYNDVWCNFPSGQMHEIGHNLGLHHSGEGTAEYADQSGMMGYSYSSDEGPEMCFNAAKNYQLGWFNDGFEVMTIAENFQGELIGQANYDSATGDQKVGVRITGASDGNDYYVSFNRKIGSNIGTVEPDADDRVLVHRRPPGIDSQKSWLVAKLSAGATYNIPNDSTTL